MTGGAAVSYTHLDVYKRQARDVGRKNPAGPRSIAGAANLLAMATTNGQGTQAEAMLFRQLMRTAQAIYSMHQAVDESRRAAEIRNALGARLDAVRARMPELVGVTAESPMTETCLLYTSRCV